MSLYIKVSQDDVVEAEESLNEKNISFETLGVLLDEVVRTEVAYVLHQYGKAIDEIRLRSLVGLPSEVFRERVYALLPQYIVDCDRDFIGSTARVLDNLEKMTKEEPEAFQ